MQLLLDHVEAVKDQVRQLAEEIEIEKINSTETADELSVWEERVRSCKDTQNVLNQEKVSISEKGISNIDRLFKIPVLVNKFKTRYSFSILIGKRS